MTGLSRALALERRGIAGQPLMLVIGVVMLWIGVRTFWLVLDAPTIGPPAPPVWLLARNVGERVALPALSQAATAEAVPGTMPRITNPQPLSAQASRLSGGHGGAPIEPWLRFAAPGRRWSFAHRPAETEGWRPRYGDPQVASGMTTGTLGGAAGRLGGAGVEPERLPLAAEPRRWAASAWMLARPGSSIDRGAPIARYGASQVGALIEYRLGGEVSPRVYVRASRALVGGGEAEIAAGVKVALGDLPLAAHFERRFAANAAGRDAMALFVSGGFSGGDRTRLAIDAYGQAGVVGLRRRVPFVDAALVARRQIAVHGPLSLSAGGGSWIGGQPGASRVDIGPRIEAQYDDGFHGRLSLDWRERVDGSAEPKSGPAMTLAFSF